MEHNPLKWNVNDFLGLEVNDIVALSKILIVF